MGFLGGLCRTRQRRGAKPSCLERYRVESALEFAPGQLEFLEEAGVLPGRTGTVTAASPDGTVTVQMDDGVVGIGTFASDRILVQA